MCPARGQRKITRYKNFTRRVAVVTLLLYKKIVVIVAKELTDEDRDRLNRGVERVIQKSDRDEMLQQLSREVAKCIAFEIGSTGNGRNPIFNGRRQPSCGGTSRMRRECQVWIC